MIVVPQPVMRLTYLVQTDNSSYLIALMLVLPTFMALGTRMVYQVKMVHQLYVMPSLLALLARDTLQAALRVRVYKC